MTTSSLLVAGCRQLAACLCLLSALSCKPDNSDKKVDRPASDVQRIADKVETSLQNATDEARQLKAKLPAAKTVENELHEVADDVEDTLKTAENELSKTSAETKAKIRKRVPFVSK